MKAVVTGGCSGLGEVLTRELLKRGYYVYALYNKSLDSAYAMEQELDNLRCIKCDIKDEKNVDTVFFNIDDIDLIINNASIAIDNNYEDKSAKEFLKVLETNVVGTFNVIKYGNHKLTKDGAIINISSDNAIDNYNPISMDYDASKAGVNMLTKDFSLCLENKVVSICPGWIATPSVLNMNQDFLKEELKRNKQKELINPEKLVNKILDEYKDYESGSIKVIKEVK